MSQQIKRCLAEERLPPQEWRLMIEKAAWTWNTMEKDDQGYSPFEVLYGQPARSRLDNQHNLSVADQEDLEALNHYRRGMLAQVRETAVQRTMSAHEDKQRRSTLLPPREYRIGQPVL
ncbi:hypothetical protein BGZ67_000802, partial [Mortierella alpina]